MDGARQAEAEIVDLTAARRKTRVRDAVCEDVLAVHATLLEALAQVDTPFPEPEMPYALQVMLDAIAQRLVAVAVNGQDEVVGVIWLDIARWPWNRSQGAHLYNQHYWVEPAYRAGGAGVRLLSWAKARADELGLPLLIEMASEDGQVAGKDAFVKAQGFRYLGGKFFREPNRRQ